MTNFMMISGIYVNERHLQEKKRFIAVNVPISLGIEPVKELEAIFVFGMIGRNM